MYDTLTKPNPIIVSLYNISYNISTTEILVLALVKQLTGDKKIYK